MIEDLKLFLDKYSAAVFAKDINAFVEMYDEEILAFDMWQDWSCSGLAKWKAITQSWFDGLGADKDLVTYEEVIIHQSSDLASIAAILKFTAVSEKGEELRHLYNRLSWVLRKRKDSWKIVHQHTSTPIDFPAMQAILDKKN